MKKALLVGVAVLVTALAGSGVLPAQQSSPVTATPASVVAGKKLFLQRCSVCHLPPLGPNPQSPFGPKLNGFVRGTAGEVRAREAIAKGTARMPGFQYGLSSKEVDDLIAYLKTL